MNFNESSGQLFAFGVMAVCGIVLCLVYDGLAVVRRKFDRWYVTLPCDVLFGAIAFSLYFLLHYLANCLKMSPFLLLAAVLGFVLCRISLSRIVAKAGHLLYNSIEKCSKFLHERGKKHGERTEN